jgi:hypothetical protein
VLHHLPPGIEARYLARAVALLKPEGEMRFGEPPDFDTAADTGPERGLHPLRDNRASHYEQLGRRWFDQVLVIPLERDGRIQAQTIVMRRRRGPG